MMLTAMQRRPVFWRRLSDRLVTLASIVALLLAVGGMCWVMATVLRRGFSALSWSFFINPSKPYGIPDSGIANALLGTAVITLAASLLTIVPAVAAGIYLAEFGRNGRLAAALRFGANVLMGIPSVLVGLFVYVVMVVPMGTFSGLAGAVALGIIMFPVIMRTTEDMLAMVPDTLRESALALGLTRARTTLCIVCRAARNGLLTGILLAIARVSGETAPLLFTAMFSNNWPTGFASEPTANMPVLITEYTTNSPFAAMHAMGWGAALVISLLVLSINLSVRFVFREKTHAS